MSKKILCLTLNNKNAKYSRNILIYSCLIKNIEICFTLFCICRCKVCVVLQINCKKIEALCCSQFLNMQLHLR